MGALRQRFLNLLWQGQDPFVGFPSNLFPVDVQGWNDSHHYLPQTVASLGASVVVEIGVWKGASTIAMAREMQRLGIDGVVLCVDTWLGSVEHWTDPVWWKSLQVAHGYPGLQRTFMANMLACGVADYVIPLPLDSVNAAQLLAERGVSADMIHLDAGHDFRSVTSDLQAWWPRLREGGILVGDDYFPHTGWPGVKRAFDGFFGPQGLLPLEQTHGKCRLSKPVVSRGGGGDVPWSPPVPTAEAPPLSPFPPARFTVCEVSNPAGRVLAVAPHERRRVTLTEQPDAADRVLACLPGNAAHTAFLLLPGGETFGIEGDGFTGPLVSFRLRQVPDTPLYELFHPIARHRRLGVLPARNSALPFGVVFDRVGDPATDRFFLAPLPLDCLSAAAAALLEDVDRVIGPPLDAERLVEALADGRLRPALAESLIRLLPADQFHVLARRLMALPASLALLQSAMPLDPWMQDALPALIAWRDGGRPRTVTMISPAAETHVAVPHAGGLQPQAGLVLQSLARRTIAPRRTAALVATVKDEGPYLLDWIAYHRAIGFEHAVIYSNDNADGSDALLDLLARQGIITWVSNQLSPGALPQVKAYGHAFKRLPDLLDYRWVMVIDADEYVGLNAGMFRTVQDFIAWQEHQRVDAIALRWLTFAAGPDDVWCDASSTQRFTRRDPSIGLSFKTLCRSNLFAASHAHFPYPAADDAFVFRWEDGEVCYHMAKFETCSFAEPRPTAALAWVAHYYLRSAGEMLLKLGRGDAWYHLWEEESQNRPTRLIEQFVRLASSDLVEDRRMLAYSEAHNAEYARLAALPGMAACSEHVRDVFRHRLALAKQAAAAFQSGADMPASYATFFRMLHAQQ